MKNQHFLVFIVNHAIMPIAAVLMVYFILIQKNNNKQKNLQQ